MEGTLAIPRWGRRRVPTGEDSLWAKKAAHPGREVPQTEENQSLCAGVLECQLLSEGVGGSRHTPRLLADGERGGGVDVVERGISLTDAGWSGLGLMGDWGVPEGGDAADLEIIDPTGSREVLRCRYMEEGHLSEGAAGEQAGDEAGDPEGRDF
jgi:hypothetical protein